MQGGLFLAQGHPSMPRITAAISRVRHFTDGDQLGDTYRSATGEPFHNKGQFDVAFTTENEHKQNIEFVNAGVEIPIISASKWARDGHSTRLEDEDGDSCTTLKSTGETDPIICRADVYFINMLVNKKLTRGHLGFGRPGNS